jgi:nucleotide-binding universal stress UspA family protein
VRAVPAGPQVVELLRAQPALRIGEFEVGADPAGEPVDLGVGAALPFLLADPGGREQRGGCCPGDEPERKVSGMTEAKTAAPRVVVGVDGSPSSRAALHWAVRYAERVDGTVDAVGAIEVPMDYGWSAPAVDTRLDEDLARRNFEAELLEALGERPPVPVQRLLVRGDPADVLIAAAEGAEVLVVGNRGRGAFARAILGSVSQRCAAHAPCPVVVVRPDQESGGNGHD